MTQLLEGVRGVGDQLADEYLAVGVKGVDDDVEELLYLGLELSGFGFLFGHNCFYFTERIDE